MLELLLSFLVSAGLGVHAYYHHRRESSKMVSARRWIFGLYAGAFLLASVAAYVQFLTAILVGSPKQPIHVFYATVVILVSYSVILVGVRRRTY